MGSRYRTLDAKLRAGVPGPGEYNNNTGQLNKSIPSIKFGTSSR